MATVASVVAAVLNLALNALFIPIFGYRAAGYTTLACYVVLGVTHYVFAQRVAREKVGKGLLDGKTMWAMAAALVVVSFAFAGLYPYPIARYAVLGVTVAVCFFKRKAILNRIREVRS